MGGPAVPGISLSLPNTIAPLTVLFMGLTVLVRGLVEVFSIVQGMPGTAGTAGTGAVSVFIRRILLSDLSVRRCPARGVPARRQCANVHPSGWGSVRVARERTTRRKLERARVVLQIQQRLCVSPL